MGREGSGANTESLLQGSPFHSQSYPRLTTKPQDQHITPKVATGGSVCSERHLLLGESNLDHEVGWVLPVMVFRQPGHRDCARDGHVTQHDTLGGQAWDFPKWSRERAAHLWSFNRENINLKLRMSLRSYP